MKIEPTGFHVILKYAKLIKDPTITQDGLQAVAQKPEATKTLLASTIQSVYAKDVKLSAEDLGTEQYEVGFETDAAISRGRGG